MAVASMAAVDDIGDRVYPRVELFENSRMERNTMLQRISIFVEGKCKSFVRFAAPVLFAVSLGCSLVPTFAQEPGQRTFASAEDAGPAFFAAMQAQDEQSLLSILGPAGKEVLSSGDAAEDSDARVGFVVKYQEMHRFVKEPNGTVTLVVGAENWPFPTKRKSNILRARRVTSPSNLRRNWSAMKADTTVCTGTVITTSSIARSTLSSRMQTEKAQRIKLAVRFRTMAIFSGSSRAKGVMHRAEPRTMSSTGR